MPSRPTFKIYKPETIETMSKFALQTYCHAAMREIEGLRVELQIAKMDKAVLSGLIEDLEKGRMVPHRGIVT